MSTSVRLSADELGLLRAALNVAVEDSEFITGPSDQELHERLRRKLDRAQGRANNNECEG
jgi:hypothetical protein